MSELLPTEGRLADRLPGIRERHARRDDNPNWFAYSVHSGQPIMGREGQMAIDIRDLLALLDIRSAPEPSEQFCEMEQEGETHDLKPGVVCIQCWNKATARQPGEPAAGHGWICVTERLPTEDELKAGVLFGIHWPEGRIEMVSWDMEYQHDYDLMCRHFEVFQPDRSQGTGYWRTSASIAPPRSPITKAGES